MDRDYATRLFAMSLDQARTLSEPIACGVVNLPAHYEPNHNGQPQQWALTTGHAPVKAQG